MKSKESIEQFQAFEQIIAAFRKAPTDYRRKINNRLTRQLHNALPAFLFWLTLAGLLNLLAWHYIQESQDIAETAALVTLISLTLTIVSRSYTVNHLLHHSIGRLGKLHTWHNLSERIGFFHRFMAISMLVWLGVHTGYKPFAAPYMDEVLLVALLGVVSIIILTSFAIFRRKYHNHFENIHRYGGYLAVTLLVAYFLQTGIESSYSLIDFLSRPETYLILAIIVLLIAPWIGVSEVYPELVHVAPHVIGMRIPGKPSFGTYTRITLSNRHFHPFGDSMIDFDDQNNRAIYITPAGDRTTEVVESTKNGNFLLTETTAKMRRFKGFMYHHANYDNILIVVTGGGIAPVIPCLVLNTQTRINVLWIGKDQPEEFTEPLLKSLMDKISNQDINIHLLNTHDPDLQNFTDKAYIALLLKACDHYNPEAAFVMSNQKFTIDAMHALKESGVKAYGATFDS
ncbi:hypothetical protein LH51_10815 [Nitrincola sp. A-D6]|uniref:hypothetical protein n=1 Tax=Nitrincola sp. A-D6 TaxID=1545442 RepID=UPI00051FAAD0|nr:hypothetical protein [Nitrincola sp. A-D6]KGK41946.1 hypothetical protein LH51_10815 [Nitrincola sp. A-D6]